MYNLLSQKGWLVVSLAVVVAGSAIYGRTIKEKGRSANPLFVNLKRDSALSQARLGASGFSLLLF